MRTLRWFIAALVVLLSFPTSTAIAYAAAVTVIAEATNGPPAAPTKVESESPPVAREGAEPRREVRCESAPRTHVRVASALYLLNCVLLH